MSQHPFVSRPLSKADRLRRPRSSLLFSTMLCFLLLSGLLADLTVGVPYTFAAGPKKPPVIPASMTLQQFFKQGRPDHVYHGPLIQPPKGAPLPRETHATLSDYNHLPASAEPATMKPIVQAVDQTMIAGKQGGQTNAPSAGGTPFNLRSSDGRLEVQVQPGSLDLSQATVSSAKGASTPVSGALTLHVTQVHGHFVGQINLLGSYQVEVVDAQNHAISGIRLLKPITFIYNYQTSEMNALDLDPDHLIAVWPTLFAAAQQAKQPTSAFVLPMTNNTKTHTLTVQSSIVGPGPLDVGGGDAQNQSPPSPHLASSGGNAGQISYSYPIQVPPGPAGFVPQLTLSYSSSNPNDRHNRTSPAGSVGDGWSLSLGSISADTYTSGAAPGTWYFLSGVDNVGDRLVQDTTITSGTFYQTEHISRLKIQQVTSSITNQICFHVWDTSGTYYEFGCTADSLQYRTDASGQHNYGWDLDRIIAPNEGANTNYKLLLVSYLQDKATLSGHTSVRDSAIKQITYGYSSGTDTNKIDTLDGTVDFSYLAPTANAPWATAYGNNYNCSSTPPSTTTLRCDDPNPADTMAIPAPTVMSTLTLQSVTSYVGSDSTGTKAYGYNMSYKDNPYTKDSGSTPCKDSYTLQGIDCSGEHLLTKVVPSVYQSGTAHALKPLLFNYSGALQDVYYDSQHTVQPGTQQYGGQSFWQYLTDYVDSNTGVGGHVTYQTAFGNTHGTPYVNGATVDDRHNPLYCWVHRNDPVSTQCSGNYAHPEDRSWSQQVVTQTKTWGTDSSATALQPATTSYAYQLAVTGQYTGNSTDCYPGSGSGTAPPGQNDCVGDDWIPANGSGQDTDWQDYFHAEFHGFKVVAITSPSNDLTVNSYYSTKGWGTPSSDAGNYDSGHLYEEDVYQGNAPVDSALLSKATNTYAGSSTHNTCNGSLPPVYNPCEVVLLSTRTTQYEGTGASNSNAPWVQHDYTYDDYNNTNGLGAGYHNLTKDIASSSNAPTVTKQLTYYTNDTTTTSPAWTYYVVNKVKHSEIDDSSGHIWQCAYQKYDEGAPAGNPTPSAGWPTTAQTYTNSNCASQSSPTITAYTGYDAYGNTVASVDGVAQATPTLYTSKGCTLTTNPTIFPSAWGKTNYTSCATYNASESLPLTSTNAFAQQNAFTYDQNQGLLPTIQQDVNGQQTHLAYSYDTNSATNGKHTVQVSQPGETGSYTSQSFTNSTCASSIPTGTTQPCFEMDSNTLQYNTAVTHTFYDSLGRTVETLAPGPDGLHTTVVFTVYDDLHHASFQSLPFVVNSRSTWLDPNGATDDTGATPAGTSIYQDALGRTIASKDALFNPPSVPGISCASFSNNAATSCSVYGLGTVSGDTNTYMVTQGIDPNNHVVLSYSDTLGRLRYVQYESGVNSGTLSVNEQKTMQYNVLNEMTSMLVTDLAPQTGQTVTSVTTTASYDDIGRLTSLNDPDRGNHTYTYDADGRVTSDVSGSRTLGYSFDLLGRLGCSQDVAPTPDPAGACTSGSNPFVKNTYDADPGGVTWGSSDYPVGRLTQSFSINYYPGPDYSQGKVTQNIQYDQRGRTVTARQQEIVTGGSLTLPNLPLNQMTMGYNDANQVVTTQTTVGGQTGYTFSPSYDSTTGTLNGLSNNGVGTANLATLSYNAQGLVSSVNALTSAGVGSSLATNAFTYDGDLRPAGTTATWQSGSGSTGTIFSQGIGYDPAGNVLTQSLTQAAVPGQTGSGGTETQNFCYDEENRLVFASNSSSSPAAGSGTCGTAALQGTLGGNYTNNFVYTHLGQLWQGSLNGSGSYQYLYCNTSQPHQLTSLYPTGTTCGTTSGKTASYTAAYDSWGNITGRTYNSTTGSPHYDGQDHMVRWNGSASNQAEWYMYDGSGSRVLRRSFDGTNITITVYAFGLEEHQYQYSGSGTSSTNTGNTYYYMLGGKLVGTLSGTSSLSTTFLLTDTLGSVVASMSNTSGSAVVQGNQAYGPYGNSRYSKGNVGTNKGFTGQYNDSLTGLDYYGARYYDPVVGRFLSADVAQGNLQGMDPYAYVGGNPETETDPTGQRFISATGQLGPVTLPPPTSSISTAFNNAVGNSWCQINGCPSGNGLNPNGVFNTPPVYTPPTTFNLGTSSHQGWPSHTTSCGAPETQATCGNYIANYVLHTPGGGQIAVPGLFCVECSNGGGGGGGDSGGGSDSSAAASTGDVGGSSASSGDVVYDPKYDEALLENGFLPQTSESQLTTTHTNAESAFNQVVTSLERLGGPLSEEPVTTQDRGLNNDANGVKGWDNGLKYGKRGWRLDYDPDKGAHFNFYDWTQKGNLGRWGAAKFPGGLEAFEDIIAKYHDFGPESQR